MTGTEKLHIVVIEDSEKHATGIVSSYQKAIREISEKGLLKEYLGFDEVSIEWLKGTKPERMRNDEKFWFYEGDIYTQIEDIIVQNKKNNIRTGILLDVALSKEEYEKASVNDYSGFKIAREIYEKFHEKAGIYIVTSIREFSSQVLSLMGTRELIKRYVSKDLVTEYPSYGVIARTIRFMHNGEELDEKEEDRIDQLT